MKTLRLTVKDFKETNFYWKEYIGTEDVSDYDGNIEIEANLGYVRFDSLKAKGYIIAESGSGIKAGDGIKAGYGIEAGEGIEAGYGIKAGEDIEAGYGIKAGEDIKAGWGIEAGDCIEAGWGIEAGYGIKAGDCIEAGWGIEAGEGIEAGLSITCKLSLNIAYRIFAGLALWKETVTDEEKTITCGKLERGEVCYGILKETGMPDAKKNPTEKTIDGAVYVLKS